MLENIEKMMVNSMYHITLAKYKAGDPFPSKTDELREAVALVIENVAFLGELALRFPDFVKKQLSKNKEWGEAVNWAYKFALDSGYYDDITEHMMHLAGQQLDLIPREEDFVNPYDRQHVKEELERKEAERRAELQEKKRQEKKMEAMKRKKRGPTMSKTEL
ncbi:hypothetical protein AB6A40_008394 [Gnathostoma spinigerum]|uniref:Coiled-coil domain-containing protein 134 n=1 Tax=Gnathostoma spinigerum TaxID=75299 RepID=A0ABD6EQ78_9BILA